LELRDYLTIQTTSTCALVDSVTAGSWNHVSLDLNDDGVLSLLFEDGTIETCASERAPNGTVASAWVGIRGESDSRQGYYPHIDDVFVMANRE
jgi:hypothetical protein